MANLRRVGDLEINEDPGFQEREWKAERVGWVAMALMVILALAGLFGPGPLAWATAGEPQSALWVDYQRFNRFKAPTELTVHLGPGSGSRTQVWMSRSLSEALDFSTVTPRPDAVEAQGDRLIYTFEVAPSDKPTSVTFSGTTRRFGWWAGGVGLVGGPSYGIGSLIYP